MKTVSWRGTPELNPRFIGRIELIKAKENDGYEPVVEITTLDGKKYYVDNDCLQYVVWTWQLALREDLEVVST